MNSYRTDPGVKKDILKTARTMFYDYGYNATSIDQIAKALDISKGLVSYHFKTKFQLANTIYDEYRIAFLHVVNQKLKELDVSIPPIYYDGIQLRVPLRIYTADEKARRFYIEIAPDLLTKSQEEHYHIIYGGKAHYSMMNLNYEEEEDKIVQHAASGAVVAMRLLLLKGWINCDYDFFEDSCVRACLRLMNIDSALIEDVVKVGRELSDKMDLQFEPYFVIK